MSNGSVLISGAGVAGPTAAYWLARAGFRPTLVERSAALRSSGSPVDVRGHAVEVARGMGIMPALRDAAIHIDELRFVDGTGRAVGHLDASAFRGARGEDEEVEILRGDLARILYHATRDNAEYLFDDAIVALEEDAEGISASFERGSRRRFDLVIGADGLHSAVRRLAFGPESAFVSHIGMYVATVPLDGAIAEPGVVSMYNAPGRAVAIHPSRERAVAAFMFRAPTMPNLDHSDIQRHKELLLRNYAGDGWRVPELLERVRETDDLYFDSVSKVLLPRWSRGRVALVGDAASCVSLFGDGSSLALAGGRALADALAAHPRDHRAAFARYEAEHRKLVDPRLRRVASGASWMVPATRWGLATRNFATRLWPVMARIARRTRRDVA